MPPRRLRGVELMIDRDRLPEADEDEIYHADLIGLSAHDTAATWSVRWLTCWTSGPASCWS
jgi:hypothetical protein